MPANLERIFSCSNFTTDSISIGEFHDILNENLSAVKNFGTNIDNWDRILLQILIKNLDRQTHISHEESLKIQRDLQYCLTV